MKLYMHRSVYIRQPALQYDLLMMGNNIDDDVILKGLLLNGRIVKNS